ncbi:MAG: translesion error-prone DNA polymerase V autoproteolytic subunit [Candidatus Dojkabacteria bacterium]|nr:translesion error-prone DNA polymerase V autoproteolytic subunit [Candidatus Dojkabacteria bacterium]
MSSIQLFLDSVPAGFPSPATDYIDKTLDINEYLVKHPAATFFVRVSGDSMIKAGIHNGDILVIDKSLEPVNSDIVLAVLDSEYTVKRFFKSGEEMYLKPENDNYEIINVKEFNEFSVWGVVTGVIKKIKG